MNRKLANTFRYSVHGVPWLVLLAGVLIATLASEVFAVGQRSAPGLIAGCLLMLFGAVWLISNRKRLQKKLVNQELQKHLEQHQGIFEAVNEALLIIDLDGTVVDINPAASEMYGYSHDEFVGLAGIDFVHPETLPLFEQFLSQLKSVGRFHAETQGMRKDGATFDIDVRGSLLSYQGTPSLLAVVEDITARKEAELELRQYARALESANRRLEEHSTSTEAATMAKSEFLADMSHELRTPLTAILGYSEMLRNEGDLSKAPPARIEAIDTIIRNGNYLLRLINDVLDLSKIEARRLEVERTACSPLEVVGEVRSLMNIHAKRKGLTLHVHCPELLPETILSDPIRLRQILINLVGNAIKFTESGNVAIKIDLLEQDPENSLLEFSVIDTGVGIAEENLSNVFRPFFQGSRVTLHKASGTGLGLAISRKLANLLGGDVTVESRPGEGSDFRLTVATGPLDDVPRVSARSRIEGSAQKTIAQASAAKIKLDAKILLAEDGPDNQRLIRTILEKAGAIVTCAENGRLAVDEALRAWKAGEPFDVVLMDMLMPVMDGYQATSELREAGYSRPILALTARAMAKDRHQCLQAGCDDYATKPINRDTLLGLIARHLDRRETVDR